MTSRRCPVCNEIVGRSARGLPRVYCSRRCKAVGHERRWRAANPEKKHEMNVRYYLANRERLKRKRQRQQAAMSRKTAKR